MQNKWMKITQNETSCCFIYDGIMSGIFRDLEVCHDTDLGGSLRSREKIGLFGWTGYITQLKLRSTKPLRHQFQQ